jgi:hypothetical protein
MEIAYSDVRSPEVRREYDDARAQLAAALEKIGRPQLAPLIDRDFTAVNVPELGPWNGLLITRLAEIGLPAAVFLMPAKLN